MFSRLSDVHRRRGVTAIEYGIIAALIIVAIIAAVAATGTNLKAVFGQIGGTLENTVAPAPAYAFGAFEIIPSSGTSFCSGTSISGFASSTTGGGILAPDGCGTRSQSTVYTDLTSNTLTGIGDSAFISNQAPGQPITVPALQGAGTGFTIPASAGAGYVRLAKAQSGFAYSFSAYSPTGSFRSTNIASMQAACTAEGGVLLYGSQGAACNKGAFYTGTEIATMLPPQ